MIVRELPIHMRTQRSKHRSNALFTLNGHKHIVSRPIVFYLSFPLIPLLSSSNNLSPSMTFESDFIRYPSSEGTGDPPLVDVDSSAAFDEEVDNDKEVGELELELSLKNLDDFYATFHDDDTPVAPNSSAATCSTDSSYPQSSHY